MITVLRSMRVAHGWAQRVPVLGDLLYDADGPAVRRVCSRGGLRAKFEWSSAPISSNFVRAVWRRAPDDAYESYTAIAEYLPARQYKGYWLPARYGFSPVLSPEECEQVRRAVRSALRVNKHSRIPPATWSSKP